MYRMYGRLVQHLESNNQQCKAKVQPAVCLFFCAENFCVSWVEIQTCWSCQPCGSRQPCGSPLQNCFIQLVDQIDFRLHTKLCSKIYSKKTATTLGQKVHFCIFFVQRLEKAKQSVERSQRIHQDSRLSATVVCFLSDLLNWFKLVI